jgi:hypothetical protein
MVKAAFAKALLKVGLKAVAPFFSDVVLAAIDQGGTLFIDERAAVSVEIRERLLARIEKALGDFDSVEGLSSAEWIIPTLTDLVNAHPVASADWVAANFDAARLSQKILAVAQPKLNTLSQDERDLVAKAVRSFYAMLGNEREIINNLENDFRNAVMNGLAAMPAAVAAQLAGAAFTQKRAVARALLNVQRRPWRPGISSPAALLRADIENPVPFHGREQDLDNLASWCGAEALLLARLYTGAGGMGKSRLMLEACNQQLEKGWRAGFLDSRSKSVSRDIIEALFGDEDTLVVVDYAETRRTELHALLSSAYSAKGTGRIRVVLLARSAGDWWDALGTEGGGVGELVSGPAAEWVPLRPLAQGYEERQGSYKIARDHFAARLKREGERGTPDDLDDEIFSVALMLHMKALAAIEGVKVKGDQGVLGYIVDRERRYWKQRAGELGLPNLLDASIGQAVALLTLNDGVRNSQEALAIFKQLPRLSDQPFAVLAALSDMLHGLYPGDRWIEPLQPDLLGEHLVQEEIERAPDEILDLTFGAAKGP